MTCFWIAEVVREDKHADLYVMYTVDGSQVQGWMAPQLNTR